jgi:hypothetical protein
MKHLFKKMMTLIIERRLVLAPLGFGVVLTSMPAFAQEIAQTTVPVTVARANSYRRASPKRVPW